MKSLKNQQPQTIKSPKASPKVSPVNKTVAKTLIPGKNVSFSAKGTAKTVVNTVNQSVEAKVVVIDAEGNHTSTVIFLHGLGDPGAGWEQMFKKVRPKGTKLVFPKARRHPVTLSFGVVMESWFDLPTVNARGPVPDKAQLIRARNLVHSLITAEESSGIESKRIVVGGFSQGGALAIYSTLTFPRVLGGLIAISTWVPYQEDLGNLEGKKNLPVVQFHGDSDTKVPLFPWGTSAISFFKQRSSKYRFKVYKGLKHVTNDDEFNKIKDFLNDVIPPQEAQAVTKTSPVSKGSTNAASLKLMPNNKFQANIFPKVSKNKPLSPSVSPKHPFKNFPLKFPYPKFGKTVQISNSPQHNVQLPTTVKKSPPVMKRETSPKETKYTKKPVKIVQTPVIKQPRGDQEKTEPTKENNKNLEQSSEIPKPLNKNDRENEKPARVKKQPEIKYKSDEEFQERMKSIENGFKSGEFDTSFLNSAEASKKDKGLTKTLSPKTTVMEAFEEQYFNETEPDDND